MKSSDLFEFLSRCAILTAIVAFIGEGAYTVNFNYLFPYVIVGAFFGYLFNENRRLRKKNSEVDKDAG